MSGPALDPSEILALRFQLSPEEAQHLTPDERMQRFYALQEQYSAALRADPVALDAFFRRNIRKRAIDWTDPTQPAHQPSQLPEAIRKALLPPKVPFRRA